MTGLGRIDVGDGRVFFYDKDDETNDKGRQRWKSRDDGFFLVMVLAKQVTM